VSDFRLFQIPFQLDFDHGYEALGVQIGESPRQTEMLAAGVHFLRCDLRRFLIKMPVEVRNA
jgi:hypothetical protein